MPHAICTAVTWWAGKDAKGKPLEGARASFKLEDGAQVFLLFPVPHPGDSDAITMLRVAELAAFLSAAGFVCTPGGWSIPSNQRVGGWPGFIRDAGGWLKAAKLLFGCELQLERREHKAKWDPSKGYGEWCPVLTNVPDNPAPNRPES